MAFGGTWPGGKLVPTAWLRPHQWRNRAGRLISGRLHFGFAGLRTGGLGFALICPLLREAPERGLNPVRNALRKWVRPARDGLWRDADGGCGGSDRSAE